MAQVKLLSKPNPETQEMFENFGREIQKTYDSMKAPFEAMFEARQQAIKTFLPIQNSLIQLANSVAPTIATFEHLANSIPSTTLPVFEKEMFFLTPPTRPLSADDIVGLVDKKLAIERLKVLESKNKSAKSTERPAVYLSKIGDLYTNAKRRYSLQDSKITRRLINVLSYEFTPTGKLVLYVGSKNSEALYKTIQAINRKAKFLLKIKVKLIEGRRGSGYRINPEVRLVRET